MHTPSSIRDRRTKLQLSTRALAAEAHVSQRVVVKLENDLPTLKATRQCVLEALSRLENQS